MTLMKTAVVERWSGVARHRAQDLMAEQIRG
jgi:hypothetical protein